MHMGVLAACIPVSAHRNYFKKKLIHWKSFYHYRDTGSKKTVLRKKKGFPQKTNMSFNEVKAISITVALFFESKGETISSILNNLSWLLTVSKII